MTDMENYMMSESETMVSAFVDGEADWVVGLFAPGHDEIRRFHDYHLIRATMRACRCLPAHQRRLSGISNNSLSCGHVLMLRRKVRGLK